MIITMTDIALPKLINRCDEMVKKGYELVTGIKMVSSYESECLHKKFDYTGNTNGFEFTVEMRRNDTYENKL